MLFIHTADWQIGRVFGQFDDEDAVPLAQARLDAVARIAHEARSRRADAVLVAGDVFDTQGVSDRTIRRLFSAMQGFEGPWLLISGNHDAALSESVWTRARALDCIGANVHVLSEPGVYPVPGVAAKVLAAPLTQRQTYDDVTAAFDTMDTPDGVARIGLAHGSIAGHLPDTIDSTNPIAADRAQRARLDYLALGDWHGVLAVDPRTWYSGTPEPDRFRENESGVALAVHLDGPGLPVHVTPIAIGRHRWLHWRRTLELPSDLDALCHELDQVAADDVLRLSLSGRLTLAQWERLQQACDRARARIRALRLETDELMVQPDSQDLDALGADGYVGTVAAELQALQADPAQALAAREALRLLAGFLREGAGTS